MNIEQLSINTIRVLGIDAINRANSGHPGMVLGAAPLAYTLFTKFIQATPKQSDWMNRDRFVLAAGHASMLLYANLHLCGYRVSLDDIKQFRQVGSITPGHPEFGRTDGVDATSGPLGQGIAHAVGMAMAERFLAQKYNRVDFPIFDHYTYALCGDGDLHEGLTQEAISLAGHFHLNKLIVVYDRNNVTLDGELAMSFTEDVALRFHSAHWNVITVSDGNDVSSITKALKRAKKSLDKPTLIIATTTIGYGSKNQNTSKVHGAPLGEEDGNHVKQFLGWSMSPFEVPEEVYQHYHETFSQRGKLAFYRWRRLYKSYGEAYPEMIAELDKIINNESFEVTYPTYELGKKEASRVTSQTIIQAIAKDMPHFIGGAADVAKSVNTTINNGGTFGSKEVAGRNINFGIREFAMSAAQTGMLLHGGVRPYVGSFLVFSDYMKASIRTAAIMNVPSIYVFTHDSIAVGEDGPTHQPIEQINTLRSIPNTVTLRPANAIETVHAWRYAVENKSGPVFLILSRQDLTVNNICSYEEFKQGAYVASFEDDKADLTLLCSGSELGLAFLLKPKLQQQGVDVRIVSIPSVNLFNSLSLRKQREILGNRRDKVIAIEYGSPDYWYKYASRVIGMESFGESGKMNDVIQHFGLDVNSVLKKILG